MAVSWLSLSDFRNHRATRVELDPGRSLVVGPNGHGKTNLIEALAMLGGGGSFRGASAEALVRAGCERAFVRAEVCRGARSHLIEMEMTAGRARVLLNGQRMAAARELAEVAPAVVFSPADLALATGGPALRRQFCDDVLGAAEREFRAARADFEKILRQRNNLLKQMSGRGRDADSLHTLDVWDAQFARAGAAVACGRARLCEAFAPAVSAAYERLAGEPTSVRLRYISAWNSWNSEAGGEASQRDAHDVLAEALAAARPDDLRRGVSTAGPQRDDMTITLDGLPARTHASQGEQRSIALALRLAQHRFLTREPLVPIVLLDDVFSELDSGRAGRLVDALPVAQTVITSATGQVPDVHVHNVIGIRDGAVVVPNS